MKKSIFLFLALLVVAHAQWGAVLGGSVTSSAVPITFSDNFIRADENPLSDGGAWTNGATGLSNMQLLTLAATGATGSAGIAYVTTPSFTAYPNQEATITIINSVAGIGPCTRVASNSEHYLAYIAGSTTIEVYRNSSGGGTLLGTAFTISPALQIGDTVTLRSVGSTHTLYVNGVSQGTRSDATYTVGSPGILSTNNTNNIGPFSCTSL